MASLPFVFGGILAGAVVIDYGTRSAKAAISSATASSGSSSGSPAAGALTSAGLSNPFPGGFQPSRLDMGFDGTFSKRLNSPVAGKVVFASPSFSNWGGYVAVQSSTPIPGLASDTFYFAEGLSPTVKVGDTVTAGQKIADPVASRWNGIVGNIEWGLADPHNPGNPLAESGISNPRGEVMGLYDWARAQFGIGATTDPSKAGYP